MRKGVSLRTGYPWGRAAKKQPTIRPTEYRCYIKEVQFQYATAGAVTPSWKSPSSSGQLPVPVALNAGSPTLFAGIIHEKAENVNSFFQKMSFFFRRPYGLGGHRPPKQQHVETVNSYIRVYRFALHPSAPLCKGSWAGYNSKCNTQNKIRQYANLSVKC